MKNVFTEADAESQAEAIAAAAAIAIAEKLTVPAKHIYADLNLGKRSLRRGDYLDGFGELSQTVMAPVEFRTMDFRLMEPGAFLERYFQEAVESLGRQLSESGVGVATFDLPAPCGVFCKARAVYNGVAVRFVGGYDIAADSFVGRIDVLFAHRTAEPATLAA
jgi:hypothetical protein